MRQTTKALVVAGFLALCGGVAQAGTLLDEPSTLPDVNVSGLTINYTWVNSSRAIFTAVGGTTANSGLLLTNGSPTVLNGSGDPNQLFRLSVALNPSSPNPNKVILNDVANSLLIKDSITHVVYASSLLHATDFDLKTTDQFGVAFILDSGFLGGSGARVVVKINAISLGITQFGSQTPQPLLTADFGGLSATADSFASTVPLPQGVWMGLAGLGMAVAFTYRRRVPALAKAFAGRR